MSTYNVVTNLHAPITVEADGFYNDGEGGVKFVNCGSDIAIAYVPFHALCFITVVGNIGERQKLNSEG